MKLIRRASAALAVCVLAATTVITGVQAADSTHLRLARTGAILSFGEVHDGLWVFTELSASTEASRGSAPSPYLWINQIAYAPDETGEYSRMVWTLSADTSDFSLVIGDRLATASVSAVDMPATRCDESGNCVEGTASVDAAFTAVGPIQRSHQRSVGSISHQSMFILNRVGASRFATATVSVDGVMYGPSTGPSDANIYDTQSGSIDVTKAAPGTRAVASGVTVYDTTGTPTGRLTDQSMFATWSSESDGVGRWTALYAATRRVSTKGTVTNIQTVGYEEQVYILDEFGNPQIVSDTFSGGDNSSAVSIAVDKALTAGTLTGATIPATSCTYVDDSALCIDTLVQADGAWAGVGATTKTQDGSSGGVAGVMLIVYRNTSLHRAATATATVDGTVLGATSTAELDRSTTGFQEVHIGR